ncbi:hypothetical protein AJ80_02873 [Polytolypa hystricis UAMH7299]|uniref:Secreted protein n=1 Tax=Polytolypa hystricis (strain UAMH7299) TaxID=1447883 RepID=A0A2B7YPY6_POLH7|nr:hypothetical protein AJ80_02873 [Polytolypa hystricis UAMH7299]
MVRLNFLPYFTLTALHIFSGVHAAAVGSAPTFDTNSNNLGSSSAVARRDDGSRGLTCAITLFNPLTTRQDVSTKTQPNIYQQPATFISGKVAQSPEVQARIPRPEKRTKGRETSY